MENVNNIMIESINRAAEIVDKLTDFIDHNSLPEVLAILATLKKDINNFSKLKGVFHVELLNQVNMFYKCKIWFTSIYKQSQPYEIQLYASHPMFKQENSENVIMTYHLDDLIIEQNDIESR